MLTSEDIKNIVAAEREVFATRADLEQVGENLRADFAKLMESVDAYSKKADTFFQELVVATHRIDRHDKWIHKIAEKLGVALEY